MSSTINLTVSGGTAPYTYLWNDGVTDANRTNVQPGNYTVTITDAHGCSITRSVTAQNASITVTAEANEDVSCYGGSDGSATGSVSGGSGTYASYSWEKDGTVVSTVQNPTDLSAGTYTLTVTDSAGATGTSSSITIDEPAALSITSSKTDVAVAGESTGAIDLIVSGGTAPYTYAWNDGVTDANRTSLAAGTYTVTVTDANDCISEHSVVVSSNGACAITSIASVTSDVLCHGECTGVASGLVEGGSLVVRVTGKARSYYENIHLAGQKQNTYTEYRYQAAGTESSFDETVNWCTEIGSVTLLTKEYSFRNTNNMVTLNKTTTRRRDSYLQLESSGVLTATRGIHFSDIKVYVNGNLVYTQPSNENYGGTNYIRTSQSYVDLSSQSVSYTYSWQKTSDSTVVSTVQNPDNLCAGSYTLTVTDAAGGTGTSSAITIDEPDALVVTSEVEVEVRGCTHPTAINYDPNATINDGSCRYPLGGCMDPTASNYNPLATFQLPNSCIYPQPNLIEGTKFATISYTSQAAGIGSAFKYAIGAYTYRTGEFEILIDGYITSGTSSGTNSSMAGNCSGNCQGWTSTAIGGGTSQANAVRCAAYNAGVNEGLSLTDGHTLGTSCSTWTYDSNYEYYKELAKTLPSSSQNDAVVLKVNAQNIQVCYRAANASKITNQFGQGSTSDFTSTCTVAKTFDTFSPFGNQNLPDIEDVKTWCRQNNYTIIAIEPSFGAHKGTLQYGWAYGTTGGSQGYGMPSTPTYYHYGILADEILEATRR